MNKKRVQRLYREERLMVRKRGGRKRALGMRAPMTAPDRPNACWSLDFVHDQMTDGRRFRVLGVVDECTRECLALVPDTLDLRRTAWRASSIRIIAWRGKPEAILSDNGTELTSNAILAWADERGVELALYPARQAGAERLRRELQRAAAGRASERDAVSLAGACALHARRLARRLQSPSPALEARLAHACRLCGPLGGERRA